MRTLMRRYPLVAFFILAYALSWWLWLLYALKIGNFPSPLFPTGPLLAGLIVSWASAGRPGLTDFLSRIVRWRVGVTWYAVVFLLPPGLVAVTVLPNILLGAPAPSAAQLGRWPLLPTFVFILLFIGLGEEPGWRGFALPGCSGRARPWRRASS